MKFTERKRGFTDEDLKRLKGCDSVDGWHRIEATKWDALLVRLEAAEAYKKAHPCTHREPHGAIDVLQIGCQYDEAWRKSKGE